MTSATTTSLSIGDLAVRSGLSEPTLRYYEQVGLIGPIGRDDSGHRRYRDADVDDAQVLACLRAIGMGIEEMRTYQANRARGRDAAAEQRDILLRHAERIEAEMLAQRARLGYLREKAALWDARSRHDAADEATASERVRAAGVVLAEECFA